MKTTRVVSTFLVAAVILAMLASPKPAQALDPWVDLGLFGGQIYSIAIDPVSTNKMFAGAYYGGGLFMTTDGGDNWSAVLTGQENGEFDGEATFRNTAVWSVKIAPSNHNVVWAVHNYWAEKSTDGGATWTHILNSTMQRDCSGCPGDSSEQFRFCRALAIHPTNPQIVYVGTGGPNGGYSNGAVYKTTDGGTSWTKMGSFDYSVLDIEIDKLNNNIVWAITSSEGYGGFSSSIYRSVNGGTTWSKIGNLATAFYDLAVRPDAANEVYVASYAGVIKYYYTGSSWVASSVKPSATNVRALAVSAQSPYRLYAAWEAVSDPTPFRVSVTENWGTSWADHTPNKQFISLAVHPTNSARVFGGELQLGVWRGDFAFGAPYSSWTELNQGINSVLVNDIDIDPHASGHLLAGTSIGVYEKKGAGVAWVRTSNFTYSAAYAVVFDPNDADGSTYYAGSEGKFNWTTNGGAAWSSSGTTFGTAKVTDIALGSNVVPGSSGTVFIATRSAGSGKIYKSTNGGSTFVQKLSSSTFDFNKVAFLPSAPGVVYAGGGNYFAPKVLGNLYKSTNGGDNWSPVLANEIVNAILIDPDNSSVVHAGCGYSGGTRVPVYESTDGGATWAKAYFGIPGEQTRYGIWGSGSNDIFVLGHHGSVVKGGEDDTKLLHYNGASWAEQDTGVAAYFRRIRGLSSSNVMAVGDDGAITRYNGSVWSAMSSPTEDDLSDVWAVPSGLDAGDYFAVGKGGTILRYERRWSPMVSGTLKDLYGVWGYVDGSSLPNVFAVGAVGTILRYSPLTNSWALMNSGGIAEQLNAVWGSSGTNVYAVGDAWRDGSQRKYRILRYNGTSWAKVTTPVVPTGKSGKLRGIWGRAWNSIYAVGDSGVILRYNGSSWAEMTSGTTADLYGVWGYQAGSGLDVVYAVGAYGTIRKYTTESGVWSAVEGITESGPPWNPVTDIKSKLEGGKRTLYASTSRQGVYASPNGGQSWTSLVAPPYDVQAISVGSVVVATQGGAYGAGWGWMWGQVFDEKTGLPIDSALVQTDAGYWHRTDANGFYHMTMPPGGYYVTGSAAGYAPEETPSPAQVLSGGATQVTFYLLDPIITVRIDGQELKAQGVVFIGTGGTIRPTAGVGYTIDAAGDLMVQYQTGWVTLGFEPIAGYGVQNVLLNGQAQGSIRSYKLINVTSPKTIEAIFRAVFPGDWDADCDVDGLDLAAFAKGGTGIDLDAFAAQFGTVGCP
jgi:hypothetical protein